MPFDNDEWWIFNWFRSAEIEWNEMESAEPLIWKFDKKKQNAEISKDQVS